VVLTPEEVQEFRDGTFDSASLVYEMCREVPRTAKRLVKPFELEETVFPKR